MKKVLCMAVVLVLMGLSVAVSAGEVFVLRNGVTFGDTMDQVRAKETLPFKTLSEENTTNLETEDGVVAGFDNVSLHYRFSDDGKLQGVTWNFEEYSSVDSIDSDYEKLYTAIVKKYGAALGFTNGKVHLVNGNAIVAAYTMVYLYESWLDGIGDIRDYDEWVVDCEDDKNTKIEIVAYYYGTSYADRNFHMKISYDQFTDADLDSELKNKQDSQQAIDDDI